MRHVADILDDKSEELVWIGPLESVFDALTLMNEKNVGAVLVQIEDYLVGILSERDYMRKVILDRMTPGPETTRHACGLPVR